ncbi:MAG: hypothetical protein JSU79_07850 [Dehalococcoidales bacterium]|nr:MAG: hypothetical protein JSU79_07850 [Dehalococcoidales bacterium]
MKRARVTEENAYGRALDRLTGNDTKTATPTPPPEQVIPDPQSTTIKLSVFLNRQEDEYLENLSSTAKFSGGKKISKTRLVENMVKAFSDTELDVRGVTSDEELLVRLKAQLRK